MTERPDREFYPPGNAGTRQFRRDLDKWKNRDQPKQGQPNPTQVGGDDTSARREEPKKRARRHTRRSHDTKRR